MVAGKLSKLTKQPVSRPRVAMWAMLDAVPLKWRKALAKLADKEGISLRGRTSEIRGASSKGI